MNKTKQEYGIKTSDWKPEWVRHTDTMKTQLQDIAEMIEQGYEPLAINILKNMADSL